MIKVAKKQQNVTFLLLVILLSSGVFAYTRGEDVDLTVPCYYSSKPCNVSFSCNISVYYPNSSKFISNQGMDFNESGIYNYTLSETDTVGDYSATSYCYFEDIADDYNFNFSIGSPLTNTPVIISILLVSIALFAFLGLKLDNQHFQVKLGMILMAFLNLISSLAVAIVALNGGRGLVAVVTTILFVNGMYTIYMFFYFIRYYYYKIKDEFSLR